MSQPGSTVDTTRPRFARVLVLTTAMVSLAAVGLAGPPAQATFGGPDGRVVFMQSQSHGSQFRIPLYTMNPDGTAVHQLTKPPWGAVDADPHWSPDGSTVVFERDDSDGNGQIYTVNADGSGLTQLTSCESTDPSCVSSGTPAWTPDGRTIVFSHCCVPANDGTGDTFVGLYTMRSDGSGIHRITLNLDPDWGDFSPTVSPDGRWVAFSRKIGVPPNNGDENVSALFLVRIDGKALHQVTPYDLMVDEKDWSPDGSRIVFVSHAGSNTGPFRADLYSVAPDGSELTQLTTTTPGQTFAFGPSWSPSGTRIMFDSYDPNAGGTRIFTMRPDGTDLRQVTPTSAGYQALSWGTAPPVSTRGAAS